MARFGGKKYGLDQQSGCTRHVHSPGASMLVKDAGVNELDGSARPQILGPHLSMNLSMNYSGKHRAGPDWTGYAVA